MSVERELGELTESVRNNTRIVERLVLKFEGEGGYDERLRAVELTQAKHEGGKGAIATIAALLGLGGGALGWRTIFGGH